MANNNSIPLKDYCEQFCKEHAIKVDIKDLLDYLYQKARSVAHNANSVGIDNATIDEWILNSRDGIKKMKEKNSVKTVVKTEPKKAETKKTETVKSTYKWAPKKKEEPEEEEEKEEEVVVEQLDLF